MLFIVQLHLKILIVIYFLSFEIDIIYGVPGRNKKDKQKQQDIRYIDNEHNPHFGQTHDYEMFQYLLRNPPEIENDEALTSSEQGHTDEPQGSSYLPTDQGIFDHISEWGIPTTLESASSATHEVSSNIGSDNDPYSGQTQKYEILHQFLQPGFVPNYLEMSSSTPFKSQVWKYFEIFNKDNGERYVRCGICSGEYKFPKEYTSTTFKRHLDGHVKKIYKLRHDQDQHNKHNH